MLFRSDDTGKTSAYVSRAFKEQKEMDFHKHAEVFNQAQRYAEQGQDTPISIASTLTDSENKALKSRQEQIRSGKSVSTDVPLYYSLKALAAEKPDEFTKKNLGLYSAKLADREKNELIDLQNGMKSQDKRTREKLDNYESDSRIVNSALRDAKIKPTSSDGIEFNRVFDGKMRDFETKNRRKATDKEKTEIADQLLVTGEVNWGRDKPAFKFKGDETFKLGVDKETRQKLADALTEEGLPVTEANMTRKYAAYLRHKKQGGK